MFITLTLKETGVKIGVRCRDISEIIEGRGLSGGTLIKIENFDVKSYLVSESFDEVIKMVNEDSVINE